MVDELEIVEVNLADIDGLFDAHSALTLFKELVASQFDIDQFGSGIATLVLVKDLLEHVDHPFKRLTVLGVQLFQECNCNGVSIVVRLTQFFNLDL